MNIKEIIQRELKYEADAIYNIIDNIDESYEKAIDFLYDCKGKVVVTGMGKTGHIGRKISATLASTGTTSIFLHAAEGIHGDLGIVDANDVVIAISYTGNSSELVSILPYFKFHKIPIIAITGNNNSKLAKNADVVLNCAVPKEVEQFGVVPTASTTLTLAIGDALAVALLQKKDFKVTDFARVHPGGTIGKKLLLRVKDLMHSAEKNPIVTKDCNMHNVILEMTSKKLGSTNVVDSKANLIGIITDGDLRRYLSREDFSINGLAQDIMTSNPKVVDKELLAVEALTIMEEKKITVLTVISKDNKPIGIIHMHDLIDAGVVG